VWRNDSQLSILAINSLECLDGIPAANVKWIIKMTRIMKGKLDAMWKEILRFNAAHIMLSSIYACYGSGGGWVCEYFLCSSF